jgi:hypothetical protein
MTDVLNVLLKKFDHEISGAVVAGSSIPVVPAQATSVRNRQRKTKSRPFAASEKHAEALSAWHDVKLRWVSFADVERSQTKTPVPSPFLYV